MIPTSPIPGPDTGRDDRLAYAQAVAPHVLDDDEMMASLGLANLRDYARAHGKVLAGEVVRTHLEPVVVTEVENADGTPGGAWVGMDTPLAGDRTEPEAYLVRWEVDVADPIRDPDPLVGAISDDGVSRAVLPVDDQSRGGQVIFRHGIAGEAVVKALRIDGTPIGYLFAVEIEHGEHQVEVLPGTATLIAEPDPDADTEGDDQ